MMLRRAISGFIEKILKMLEAIVVLLVWGTIQCILSSQK